MPIPLRCGRIRKRVFRGTQLQSRGKAPAVPGGAAGFTLVEVMVTVAVVGILASLAYPAYSDYMLRGRVVDAGGLLTVCAADVYAVGDDGSERLCATLLGTARNIAPARQTTG